MREPVQFELKPFTTPQVSMVSICGSATRAENTLSITYLLSGELDKVMIPPPNQASKRRNHLWKKTCFEFFLRSAQPNSSQYWEFNLSPAGDWNVFSLTGYRQGLQEERAIATLPFKTELSSDKLSLSISVDIAALVGSQDILLGISTVLILEQTESFWAIAHPTQKADFHHPDSFALRLPK